MLDSNSIAKYFSKLPNDFTIIVGNNRFQCNKQSISCFSEKISKIFQEQPKLQEYKLEIDINPKALELVISALKYEPIQINENIVFDLYITSVYLEIQILQNKFEDAFYGSLNPSNIQQAFFLLQNFPNSWNPLITFFNLNPEIFIDFSYNVQISPTFISEMFSKNIVFRDFSEEQKLEYIENYLSRNGNAFISDPFDFNILYSYLDSSKFSLETVLHLSQRNDSKKLSSKIDFFPFIRKMLIEQRKIELHNDQMQKNIEKMCNDIAKLDKSKDSKENIDIRVKTEFEKYENSRNKLSQISYRIEYLTANIEMLFIIKRKIVSLLTGVLAIRENVIKLMKVGNSNNDQRIINNSNQIIDICSQIETDLNKYDDIDDCAASIQVLIGCAQALKVF